ncbi:tripartite tricarboxylate transporter TctB family protein [Acuticoccus kandeliae]|uniref:tripartite tricarboxylate transporter TctB family protein n=1 Tax=Acuticoccus kandeliae TaxID=2073160 RepID=UPI000D3E3E7D|nr:tripartite tricarboxylate transporter TctB family protein [Acuticoccus kandeliae]
MTSRRLEIAAALGFLGLAAAGWWASAALPPDPRMMPRLVLALIALASAFWLFRLLRAARPAPEPAEPVAEALKMPAVFALTGVYAVLVVSVGFFIPTLAYIVLMARLLGERRWVASIAAAIGFAIVAYLLFVVLFERPVPL